MSRLSVPSGNMAYVCVCMLCVTAEQVVQKMGPAARLRSIQMARLATRRRLHKPEYPRLGH